MWARRPATPCRHADRPPVTSTSGESQRFLSAWVTVGRVVIELDHVFCLVSDPDEAARRLEGDGWTLDAGRAHGGQGTRNRRPFWPEQYFELLWVCDAAEARTNPLRLDRRAHWRTTGASPFGLGFRGRV